MKLLQAIEGGLLARGESFVYITVAWLKMENREQKLNKHLMPWYSILGDKGKGDTICPICKYGCNHIYIKFGTVSAQSSPIGGSFASPCKSYQL